MYFAVFQRSKRHALEAEVVVLQHHLVYQRQPSYFHRHCVATARPPPLRRRSPIQSLGSVAFETGNNSAQSVFTLNGGLLKTRYTRRWPSLEPSSSFIVRVELIRAHMKCMSCCACATAVSARRWRRETVTSVSGLLLNPHFVQHPKRVERGQGDRIKKKPTGQFDIHIQCKIADAQNGCLAITGFCRAIKPRLFLKIRKLQFQSGLSPFENRRFTSVS